MFNYQQYIERQRLLKNITLTHVYHSTSHTSLYGTVSVGWSQLMDVYEHGLARVTQHA